MKKILMYLCVMLVSVMSFTSCTPRTVEPGQEGFVFAPYSGGVQKDVIYADGTHFVPIWNEMIVYNTLQQSKNYKSLVLEKNGMEIGIDITVNYNPTKGKTPSLHLKHGVGYESSLVDAKVRGIIKDVVGKYTYEEIYSTKREKLETEMDILFQEEFPSNFVTYNFVEIADVNLPPNVNEAITAKETQKQNNQKAKELEQEQEYLANAEITKATGEKKARVLRAEGRAQEIALVQKQLSRSPSYIELVKWKGYADGKGSPYGTNNMYGVSTSIMKNLK
jgi:regulator of protease activity HflC (stomatin/prohibitin superfamily)